MLQLKLNKVSMSADGTTLTVIDGTGAYNGSTNPTGYGTPNRAISSNIILRWKLYNDTDWVVIPGITGGDLASGVAITTISLGQSNTADLLQDGVEFVQYLGLYSKGATVTTTPGSDKVLIPNFTLSDFTGIDYIAFSSDLTSIYGIKSRGTGYLILDRCYTGSLTTTETIYDAQNGDLFELVQTYSNQRLDSQVAGTSVEQFYGKQLDTVFNRIMRIFIAQACFDREDYYGADLITRQLYTECFNQDFHDRY